MAPQILKWQSSERDFTEQLKNIFYITSSVKTFESELQRERFFLNWTSYYFKNYPDETYLAVADNELMGYLTGCSDSMGAVDYFADKVASYSLFKDQFIEFPAHLHINFHPKYQSSGYGSLLVNNYIEDLREKSVAGLHIVTTPLAKNVNFYLRNGFERITIKNFHGSDLLFMGRKI